MAMSMVMTPRRFSSSSPKTFITPHIGRHQLLTEMQGFPFDFYSLGFVSTVFLVYLGLVHLIKSINTNNFVQENGHMNHRGGVQRDDAHAVVDDQAQMMSSSSSSTSVNTQIFCSFCGDDRTITRCSRCKAARYCSGKCQIKHWRTGHRIECEPIDVDYVSGVSSEGIGTSHQDISISDHHRDQDQMPSTSASPYVCLVCGDDKADISCTRCKVARYCSGKCQIKHWRTLHWIECKPTDVDSVSGVSSEGIGTSHTDISSSDHHRDLDQMPSTSASPYVCLVCGDDKADISCARCKVARYCSGKCQIKHWRTCHRIECKPTDVDFVSSVSSEGIGTSHTDISSSDHHRDQDQMPSTSASPYVCLVCGDDKADISCARCKVARYCTQKCQIKHWRAGHRSECKEYKSLSYADSAYAVSSESRGSDHVDISSSDHHRVRDHVPSAPATQDFCFVCGDWSDIRCNRCKVVRYCSQACETKHWREGHKLECKENKSPANAYFASAVSERRGPGHVDTSSSEYQQSKKDGKLANTVQSPKRISSKELPSLEECPICFSTIHTSEPSSPFLACEICKHKFHATCLLKWFSTSKKSQCPLCQSPFKSEGAAV